jgi:hypothetical protein
MSFLIYSESFDRRPLSITEHVYQRFWEILTGRDHAAAYTQLASADRQAVLEILKETKAEFRQTLALDGG